MRSPSRGSPLPCSSFLSAVTAVQRGAERCGGAVGRGRARALPPHPPSSHPLSAPGFKVGGGVKTATAELASSLWST